MLTTRQLTILLNIRSGINDFRSLNRAIGCNLGDSTSNWHCVRLRARGLVTWKPYRSRTIRLTKAGQAAIANYVLLRSGIGKIIIPERKIELTLRIEREAGAL